MERRDGGDDPTFPDSLPAPRPAVRETGETDLPVGPTELAVEVRESSPPPFSVPSGMSLVPTGLLAALVVFMFVQFFALCVFASGRPGQNDR